MESDERRSKIRRHDTTLHIFLGFVGLDMITTQVGILYGGVEGNPLVHYINLSTHPLWVTLVIMLTFISLISVGHYIERGYKSAFNRGEYKFVNVYYYALCFLIVVRWLVVLNNVLVIKNLV